MTKLIIYPQEEFKLIELPLSTQKNYAISNYGRLISFYENIKEGKVLKPSMVDGYATIAFRRKIDNKNVYTRFFIYKLVANYFLKPKSANEQFVIHLDYVRDNDYYLNLKWVTEKEKSIHYKNSPHIKRSRLEAAKRVKLNPNNSKLTSTEVIRIKTILKRKPETKVTRLAKQFGVNEMQIYRIKRGENWGHIKIN